MRQVVAGLCWVVVLLLGTALLAEEVVQIDPSGLSGGRYRLDLNRLSQPILDCYAKALEQNTQARGRIKVRVTIEMTGDTRSVEVLEDTMGVAQMTACVTKLLKDQKWPKANTVVFFAYTFQFTPTTSPAPTPTGG